MKCGTTVIGLTSLPCRCTVVNVRRPMRENAAVLKLMRRGVIAVGGQVRDFAGLEMKGGTIILRSGAELRTGAWISRGTIISLTPIRLLPTFRYSCTYNPTFLRVYARHLSTLGFAIPSEEQDGAYQRYTGDAAVPGKGEILVWKPRAS